MATTVRERASLTKDSVFKVDGVELNRGVSYGVSNITYSFTHDIEERPSGTSGTDRQSMDREDFNTSFSAERNQVTRPLFRNNKTVKQVEIGVDGPATGNEKLTASMLIASKSIGANFKGKAVMDIMLVVDGVVTEGTY